MSVCRMPLPRDVFLCSAAVAPPRTPPRAPRTPPLSSSEHLLRDEGAFC